MYFFFFFFFFKAVLPLQENFSNLGSSPDHVPAQLGVTFKPCLSLQHFPPSTLPTLIAVFFTRENRKSPRRAYTFSSTQCAAESAEIPTREQHFSCRLWFGWKTLQSVKSREETGFKGGWAMWGLRSHDPSEAKWLKAAEACPGLCRVAAWDAAAPPEVLIPRIVILFWKLQEPQ